MRPTPLALLVPLLCCAVQTPAWAELPADILTKQRTNLRADQVHSIEPSRTRGDTLWLGGEDGSGYAFEGGTWDFEGTGGAGDFQGWTSRDPRGNRVDYFSQVTSEDFADDPCSAMFPGTIGQLWCGIHEAEALDMDFLAGMGYMNYMCQWARSQRFALADMTIDLDYFNDSEADWDYTYLRIACFSEEGEIFDEIELARLTGVLGAPSTPLHFNGSVLLSDFPAGTDSVAFEMFFDADGAWSDQDGLYDCACGPFAADNIVLTVGGTEYVADFEESGDGYTFGRCGGMGTFMGLVDESTYSQWLEEVGVACVCPLDGWVLETNDEENSPFPIPGHLDGQWELLISNIVNREGFDPEEYNHTVVAFDLYAQLGGFNDTYYRPGYMYYPYTSEVNPEPHWSPRLGPDAFWHTGSTVECGRTFYSLSTLNGEGGTPLPNTWEKMRFVYDIYCDCWAGIFDCEDAGNAFGSPLIDDVRIGLTHQEDRPAIALSAGHAWQDGYGQNFPGYFEPSDVGNANVTFDLSGRNQPERNDWHADSAVIEGPLVTGEDNRWLVELCFRLAERGPMQNAIPEYAAWKARLNGDPEEEFVCVLMDSVVQGHYWPLPNKFASYFDETDPGFDPSEPELSPAQEILPDGIWTPGTRIEYYYLSYWYDGGASPRATYSYPAGHAEFEILPRMREVSPDAFEIQWPCVLYVDAFNHGAEVYIEAMLASAGVEYDKYDYLDATASWACPLVRSFGGTTYNPGGYGNNGLTAEQALGYRLILLDTGGFGPGTMEQADWLFFAEWLAATECGVESFRRGLLFCGSQIATNLHYCSAESRTLLEEAFGATLIASSFYEHSNLEDWCVHLAPSEEASYVADLPLTLYGNGCPAGIAYDVLGLSGAEGAVGNLDYSDGSTHWPYAQIVRDRVEPGTANWRSSIAGLDVTKLSHEGCLGADCDADSACTVESGADFLASALAWMSEGASPFDLWSHTDHPVGVEDESHLGGRVTHLFPARPSPFHRTAVMRFSLAYDGHAQLHVYDVSGRHVRSLVDHELSGGREYTVTWDGCDDRSSPVGAGVFWVHLSTEDGYRSSSRIIVMR